MLNKIIIYLFLLFVWTVSLFFANIFTINNILFGATITFIITYLLFVSSVFTKNSEFLFFQFSFYWYIFVTLNKSFLRVIKLCFYLLNPFKKFTSIIDYIFLDKDSDSRAVLTANILSLQPGIIGTLLKKRYLIIHSMDESFFSLNDLYKTSSQVEEIKND